MGETKWQAAQCWNERRVNLIDKHRWCLNLTTLRSYLTTCCSLLALAPVLPRESLSLSPFGSVPPSRFVFLSSFLVAARIEQPYSRLPDLRCKIATAGRMKFRLLDKGERGERGGRTGRGKIGNASRAERESNRFREARSSRGSPSPGVYVIFPLRRERIFRARAASASQNIACTTALSGLSPWISVKTRR